MLSATGEREPAISVVIPVYNGSNYLGEAIESVLAQSYCDLEIIVVDDGSTDNTWLVIERYMAAYPDTVRGIRKANGGVATALNAGICAAKGKYFAWLSHDDRFVPNKLQQQMDLLKSNPDVVGVYADYSYIDADGRIVGRVFAPWYPQGEMHRHLLQSVFINGSTLLIERRCLLEVGLFDATLRYAQDALMWIRLVMRYSLAHIAEPLTEYRVHVNQTTNTTKRRAIRRDNAIWLNRAIDDYPIQQIFPELDRPDLRAPEIANAYIYLGEVFVRRYYHWLLGIKYFWKAWSAWPNLRNPVAIKTGLALARSIAHYLKTRTTHFQFGENVPNNPEVPIVMDLRPLADLVKYESVTLASLASKK
jgi:glycosyltransferase involved in cell wall biosynthesis